MRNAVRRDIRSAPPERESNSLDTLRSYVASPPDTWLFVVVALLVAIGMMMIFSASNAMAFTEHQDAAYYLKRQLIWLVVGAIAAYGAFRIDYLALRKFAPYFIGASILGLVAVLVPHRGIDVNGARRWLGAGPLSIQPSEFAKLSLVIYLAAVLAARGERVTSLVRGLFAPGLVVAVTCMLVVKEPDMGTASLLAFTAITMFFLSGARISHLVMMVGSTLPVVTGIILLNPYQRARIFAFIDPWKDPQNYGFHIIQSLYALGSGGMWGMGLGASRAKFFYLPEQYTDFIFSVLGEELGLFGTLVVVMLFLVLAYRATKIALAAPDRFGFLLASGCAAFIVIQAFVNIGVVTSSWPVTGVPLPFISFGGSSLVVNLVAVALIANVGRYRRIAGS